MIHAVVVLIYAVCSALLLGVMILLCAYQVRKRRIAEFARRVTQGTGSQRDAAFALGREIFGTVKRGKDPVFLSRVLAPLGASPVTILERGGCCSGVHRLLITSLDTIGIQAAQITVFRRADPAAAHCLVQVIADGANILIDADYGVWLHRADGQPLDLVALRSGEKPVIAPFVLDRTAPSADSTRTRPAGYPDDAYYRFDYELTRTANWAESRAKRALYSVLHPLTRGRLDYLLLPAILEWPEVLLAVALSGILVLLLAARVLA